MYARVGVWVMWIWWMCGFSEHGWNKLCTSSTVEATTTPKVQLLRGPVDTPALVCRCNRHAKTDPRTTPSLGSLVSTSAFAFAVLCWASVGWCMFRAAHCVLRGHLSPESCLTSSHVSSSPLSILPRCHEENENDIGRQAHRARRPIGRRVTCYSPLPDRPTDRPPHFTATYIICPCNIGRRMLHVSRNPC